MNSGNGRREWCEDSSGRCSTEKEIIREKSKKWNVDECSGKYFESVLNVNETNI